MLVTALFGQLTLYLRRFQLKWCTTAENLYLYLEFAFLGVEIDNLTGKSGKWADGNFDMFAYKEVVESILVSVINLIGSAKHTHYFRLTERLGG